MAVGDFITVWGYASVEMNIKKNKKRNAKPKIKTGLQNIIFFNLLTMGKSPLVSARQTSEKQPPTQRQVRSQKVKDYASRSTRLVSFFPFPKKPPPGSIPSGGCFLMG